MSRKKKEPSVPDSDPADREIRRYVAELHATITAALNAGWDGRRPEPEPGPIPSLEDHYRAIGMRPPAPRTVSAHLRTRKAIEPVAVALCQLINRGSFHGGDLVQRCAETHTANRAVLAAEQAGWITRGKYELTSLQQFAGGAGHLPGTEWLHPGPGMNNGKWTDPPLGHHWITATTKYLEVPDVEAMLRGEAP